MKTIGDLWLAEMKLEEFFKRKKSLVLTGSGFNFAYLKDNLARVFLERSEACDKVKELYFALAKQVSQDLGINWSDWLNRQVSECEVISTEAEKKLNELFELIR